MLKLLTKKGNYCSPSSVTIGSSVKASGSSVGPLVVSEGEVQELPHCSHLHSLLYVLCVVVLVHPINKRDVKIVNKMFLILYKYIWWLILFAVSLCWCFTLFYMGKGINQSYGDFFKQTSFFLTIFVVTLPYVYTLLTKGV